MKVIFYSPQFLPSIGGLQNVVRDWAEGLTKLGCKVVVITKTPASNQNESFNFSVLRSPGFWETIGVMRSGEIVVMFNVALKAMPQVFLSLKPLIVTHHSGLYYRGKWQPFQILKEWVANYIAKKNVACSHFVGQDYNAAKVIYSPYNESVFNNLHLERDGDFLFVGRLVTDKGCDLLLGALARLHKNQSKKFSLTIIGTGPEEKNLVTLSSKFELTQYVKFSGALSPALVAEQMNKHRVLVVPSNVEPFGIVVLEGLACGCRVIVSEKGGLVEAGGDYASYIKDANPDELASLLEQSISEPSTGTGIGIESHLANCSIANTSRQLKEVIENVLEKK